MFFLKHATESSFLISIGVLFHSLVAETAKERPPSVSLLYLGQTALMLEYLVLRECRLLFKINCYSKLSLVTIFIGFHTLLF